MKKRTFQFISLGFLMLALPGVALGSETGCFFEQPAYTGNCQERPPGTVCIGFSDGYILLVNDVIQGWWNEVCNVNQVEVAIGFNAEYYHILGTNFIKFATTASTVSINGCDTGVGDNLLDVCCTITDLVLDCIDNADNHGKLASCVAHLTNELKAVNIISDQGKVEIQECAAQAEIP